MENTYRTGIDFSQVFVCLRAFVVYHYPTSLCSLASLFRLLLPLVIRWCMPIDWSLLHHIVYVVLHRQRGLTTDFYNLPRCGE